jgi:hypothetical protein
MSEPSSLVMQVHITVQQWVNYLTSEVRGVQNFDDWNLIDEDFQPSWLEKIDYGQTKTAQDWLAACLPRGWPGVIQPLVVDPERDLVTCVVLEFSENLIDFIDALNVLRRVAQHKDSSESDFVLIYPYFWNPKFVFAAIELSAGKSRFLDPDQDRDLIEKFLPRAGELIEQGGAVLQEMAKRTGP